MHTQGKWEIRDNPYHIHVEGVGIIAQAFVTPFEGDYSEAKANARLVASAPELLEALERINSDWLTSSGHSSEVTRHMTRALIARAKGDA